jgi:hypothetical protein
MPRLPGRYWLTPGTVRDAFFKMYGPLDDPYPYPRGDADALRDEWPTRCYFNPPYLKKDGGIAPHIRRAIDQSSRGRFVAGIVPCSSSTSLLLRAGARLSYIDRVRWLDVDSGRPQPSPGPVMKIELGTDHRIDEEN